MMKDDKIDWYEMEQEFRRPHPDSPAEI